MQLWEFILVPCIKHQFQHYNVALCANPQCHTNFVLSHIHLNTTKLRNTTCTLVAMGVIIRSLEYTTMVFYDIVALVFFINILFMFSHQKKRGCSPVIIHFWTCRILCHFLIHFLTCPPMILLFLVTLCKTKWDYHSFLNQEEILERDGRGH